MNKYWSLGLVVVASAGLSSCAPGYMKATELDSREQGPSHCAERCHELGMEMGALVLVGDTLPGCVCQPRGGKSDVASEGASGATAGHAVLLAAAAAARQQQEQQQQASVQSTSAAP